MQTGSSTATHQHHGGNGHKFTSFSHTARTQTAEFGWNPCNQRMATGARSSGPHGDRGALAETNSETLSSGDLTISCWDHYASHAAAYIPNMGVGTVSGFRRIIRTGTMVLDLAWNPQIRTSLHDSRSKHFDCKHGLGYHRLSSRNSSSHDIEYDRHCFGNRWRRARDLMRQLRHW